MCLSLIVALLLLVANTQLARAEDDVLECNTSDSWTWWVVFAVLVLVFVIIVTVFVTYYVASTVSQSTLPAYASQTVAANMHVPVTWSQIGKSQPSMHSASAVSTPNLPPTFTAAAAQSSPKSLVGRPLHRSHRDVDDTFDPYELTR